MARGIPVLSSTVFHKPSGDCGSAAREVAAGIPANTKANKASVAVRTDSFIVDILVADPRCTAQTHVALADPRCTAAVATAASIAVVNDSTEIGFRRMGRLAAASGRDTVEPRFLRDVVASPGIWREQRAATGTHGVSFAAGVMNQRSGGPSIILARRYCPRSESAWRPSCR